MGNNNNNFPNSNNKLPEGWGNSNNGDGGSPWENTPKTTAWENSSQASPWENTNNNSENRASNPKGINTENVNAAFNKFANMAKKAGEKAVNAAKTLPIMLNQMKRPTRLLLQKNGSYPELPKLETLFQDLAEKLLRLYPPKRTLPKNLLKMFPNPLISLLNPNLPKLILPQKKKLSKMKSLKLTTFPKKM